MGKAPAIDGALGHNWATSGPRHPLWRVPWARCQKIFKFTHINFFKKPNKKIYNKAKELHCDVTTFFIWFFIFYFPKKCKLKNGPSLPTLPYIFKILQTTSKTVVSIST